MHPLGGESPLDPVPYQFVAIIRLGSSHHARDVEEVKDIERCEVLERLKDGVKGWAEGLAARDSVEIGHLGNHLIRGGGCRRGGEEGGTIVLVSR